MYVSGVLAATGRGVARSGAAASDATAIPRSRRREAGRGARAAAGTERGATERGTTDGMDMTRLLERPPAAARRRSGGAGLGRRLGRGVARGHGRRPRRSRDAAIVAGPSVGAG